LLEEFSAKHQQLALAIEAGEADGGSITLTIKYKKGKDELSFDSIGMVKVAEEPIKHEHEDVGIGYLAIDSNVTA
jgi:hypothetical protein